MTNEQAINYAINKFEDAGIDDAKIDAFLLLNAATGIDKASYYLKKDEELEEKSLFMGMVEKRADHVPCQYIIGKTNFMGFDIYVNENVLIPRQDTETVVEETLKRIADNKSVLDMCTGSAAIAIALKKFNASLNVSAADISKEALDVAKKNVEENGCEINLIQSDLFEKIISKFDVIISNPPYVTDDEYEKLAPEVKEHEPKIALKAGKDGLDIYKKLIPMAANYLNDNGMISLEIGCNQALAVKQILEENGFINIEIIKDLPGLDRNMIAYKGE